MNGILLHRTISYKYKEKSTFVKIYVYSVLFCMLNLMFIDLFHICQVQ